MEKEIYSKSKVGNSFTLATVSTETETLGAEIDTKGFNSLLIILKLAFTTGEISAIKVYASDTSGSYSSAETVTTLFNPDQLPLLASGVAHFASVAKKRYIKIGITSANYSASVNFTCSGVYVLSDAFVCPPETTSMFESEDDINAPGDLSDDYVSTPPLIES